MNRAITCPLCGQDIEVRSGQFAHQTLSNHYKREGHKAKAAESYRLFYEQLPDQAQQDICVENLVDFIKATRQVESLTAGEGLEWLNR